LTWLRALVVSVGFPTDAMFGADVGWDAWEAIRVFGDAQRKFVARLRLLVGWESGLVGLLFILRDLRGVVRVTRHCGK